MWGVFSPPKMCTFSLRDKLCSWSGLSPSSYFNSWKWLKISEIVSTYKMERIIFTENAVVKIRLNQASKRELAQHSTWHTIDCSLKCYFGYHRLKKWGNGQTYTHVALLESVHEHWPSFSEQPGHTMYEPHKVTFKKTRSLRNVLA